MGSAAPACLVQICVAMHTKTPGRLDKGEVGVGEGRSTRPVPGPGLSRMEHEMTNAA